MGKSKSKSKAPSRVLRQKSILNKSKQTLILYLKMKVEQADWHGVGDAANDLRVLECKLESI
jgi:hypothetical protein